MTGTLQNKIEFLIQSILPYVEKWIEKGDDGLGRLIDPIDGAEISAHYGATHTAAAFIVWGKLSNNCTLYDKGISLLKSISIRWNTSKCLPAFHADFNNFAMTVIWNYVDDNWKATIENIVLSTPDSRHDTVNWLPMRWTVNLYRYKWTNNKKYLSVIDACKYTITEATNNDGGIEDRLPYGTSFNTQYDLATVAVLQYLRIHGEMLDISKELGFLLNSVSPDGDINYLGRGTNQVFAWGMWIYLLSSTGRSSEAEMAVSYLNDRIHIMLQNKSMMLNEWNGQEKYLWWDYHYVSVYTAHCLLWLILALRDCGKATVVPTIPSSTETGVHIVRTNNRFVSWFEGRHEYLAERGPAIAAIWMKERGIICKGTFGPWQGLFGNKYIFDDIVIKNYCGLIEIKRNNDWSRNRYLHKFLPVTRINASVSYAPLFCPIEIDVKNSTVVITWTNNKSVNVIVNVPMFTTECHLILTVDDNEIFLSNTSTFRNQYTWVYLFQSRAVFGRRFQLTIL